MRIVTRVGISSVNIAHNAAGRDCFHHLASASRAVRSHIEAWLTPRFNVGTEHGRNEPSRPRLSKSLGGRWFDVARLVEMPEALGEAFDMVF